MDPKEMWDAGNFAAVAERILEAGELVVARAGVEPGMDLLDVACGTGNATIPAARSGARTTGLDFAPGLLDIARERAADAMVDIDFVEGNVQEMPFEDASFDRVVSTFGHMFAPDHRRTADEMRRVLRPGGVIAVACWTPEGSAGRMADVTAHLVPSAPGGESPMLWGTEDHVRAMWGDGRGPAAGAARGAATTFDFQRHEIVWTDPSVESYARFMLESSGPLLNAREMLAEREAELDEAFRAYLEEENEADDGTFRFRGEYLLSIVRWRR
jgi:SAM-dependent methyltransferase